jgi:predicted RND superfamily exporter protein
LIRKLFEQIGEICLRHSRRILVISLIVAVGSIAAATRLTFDPDILNLVPQRNKEINDFRKVLKDLGTIDYHIVVIDIPQGHDVSEYESLISGLASRYSASPLIQDVDYRIPNPVDLIDEILPQALLFLTPAELERVGDLLTDSQIRETVARNRTMLQTPQGLAMKQLVQYDPFQLLPIFLDKFKKSGGGFSIDASSGYYLSADHSTLLILVKPKKAAQNVPFARAMMAEKDRIEREAVAEFRKSAPATPVPPIGYTGGYAIAFADAELIKGDITANVLFSFFGVLALFLYAFRRVASVGYAGIPMALGLAITFGIAGIVYGQLSSASAGFAALLAGLGIDFITVMYGRYVDERNRGESTPDAIRTVCTHTLPGVGMAAITTAGTFFAFLATDFRGMSQLGLLTGTGILFFLLCVAFVLPSLIIQGDRKQGRRAPKLYLHSFGSDHLVDWSLRRPKLVVGIWAVFLLVAASLAPGLHFSDNLQDLRAKGNPGIVMQEKLTKRFGQSFDFMMYVNQDRTLEGALEKSHEAGKNLDPLVAGGAIASYQSLGTYLPPLAQQQAVMEILRRGANDRFSPDRVERTFRSALIENGFRPEAYNHFIELFRQALTPTGPVSLSDFSSDETLSRLISRFIKKTPEGYTAVAYLYPVGGRWGRDVSPQLLAAARKQPGAILTGVNLASGVLRGIVRADAVRATLIGLAAVVALMLLNFKSVKMTLLSFVPFVAGAVGMLGLMSVFKLEFNFMNIFVGLMIVGVATDYAIYMLQRYIESGDDFANTAAETGKAVVMAALTAIVAYGSFAISHYPGLRSIGYASTFGIGLSGLAAITLLPALLVLLKKPGSSDREAA